MSCVPPAPVSPSAESCFIWLTWLFCFHAKWLLPLRSHDGTICLWCNWLGSHESYWLYIEHLVQCGIVPVRAVFFFFWSELCATGSRASTTPACSFDMTERSCGRKVQHKCLFVLIQTSKMLWWCNWALINEGFSKPKLIFWTEVDYEVHNLTIFMPEKVSEAAFR